MLRASLLLITILIVVATLVHGSSTRDVLRRIAAAKPQLRGAPKLPTPVLPGLNVTLVAEGFVWCENLWADGNGGLWASDDMAHHVFKLTRPSGQGMADKQLWLDGAKLGFKNVLGLHPVPGTGGMAMYVIASLTGKGALTCANGATDAVLKFSTTTPGAATVFACTSDLGNGIAVVNGTSANSSIIFTASEGGFIPTKGVLMSVNPATRAAAVQVGDLYAADGMWLDERAAGGATLYASEVLEGKILTYKADLATGQLSAKGKYKAPGCKMVDDFCVMYRKATTLAPTSQPTMFAADFWADKVVAFAADGSGSGTVLVEGLQSPTSVRPGFGKGFDNPKSIFVSEGGGFLSFQNTRRVFELTFP